MKLISTLRRVIANSDRVNELVAASDRLQQAADNLATNANQRLDRLHQATDNLATDTNQRLDRLHKAAEGVLARLEGLHHAVDNQAEGANRRLDQLTEAASSVDEGLVRLWQSAESQSGEENRRLDQLIEVAKDQQATTAAGLARLHEGADNQSGGVNRKLDLLIEAVNNQSTHANERLEELIRAIATQGAGVGSALRELALAQGDAGGASAARERGNAAGPNPSPLPNWKGRQPLPFPVVDLSVDNPIPTIIDAPEFAVAAELLSKTEASKRALLSAASTALIYTLVRNAKPRHVVEIGTFNGGTSEIICRALEENGFGVLHTVGPFDAHRVAPIFDLWPNNLRRHLKFYPVTSMDLYYQLSKQGVSPEIALVDGDHCYEAALFDIQTLAKSLTRGGFLLVDNISQAGPYYATMDFLSRNPNWRRCKAREPKEIDPNKAFDRERRSIPRTDFEIIRAPLDYSITGRPTTFGELPSGSEVKGLRILADSAGGILHAQCVLRGFGPNMAEKFGTTTLNIETPGSVDLLFSQPLAIEGAFSHCTVEPWLSWNGEAPLSISEIPTVIA